MSEPAKSAEAIEDVLASIRRLVSGPSPARDMPQQDAAERLVLTPSLRVTDPDDPWAPVPLKVEERSEHDTRTDFSAAGDRGEDTLDPAWGLEDRLADWGEISDSAAEAITDAMSEGHGAGMPDQAGAPRFSRTDPPGTAPGLAEFEPETGDADWPDAGADNALRELVLARGQITRLADGLETAAPDHGSQIAPEITPHDPPVAEAVQDEDQDALQDAALAHPAPDAGSEMAEDDIDDDDDADEDDLDDDIEDLGPSASPFAFPDPEVGVLDEETLREIVAEVVRQELQGVLGQRITRNVRKMVRREIRLARAAEELE